jgi:hypothetical protein
MARPVFGSDAAIFFHDSHCSEHRNRLPGGGPSSDAGMPEQKPNTARHHRTFARSSSSIAVDPRFDNATNVWNPSTVRRVLTTTGGSREHGERPMERTLAAFHLLSGESGPSVRGADLLPFFDSRTTPAGSVHHDGNTVDRRTFS